MPLISTLYIIKIPLKLGFIIKTIDSKGEFFSPSKQNINSRELDT